MLVLPKVFSDNALYLHSATLEVRGISDALSTVSVKIIKNGEVFSQERAEALGDGSFSVSVKTPAASYDTYELTVSNGAENVELKNVLFGELWLACGQSNMEMPNHQQPEWETEMVKKIAGKCIRAFGGPRLPAEAEYPIKPMSDTNGWWMTSDEKEKMKDVSALATAFSNELFDFFVSRGQEIPVGFLNCNRGGTCLETWLPSEAFDKYPKISYKKPDSESWNKKGRENYQQPTAHYNFNTHPHIGVKARGMLWYQGESNLCAEQTQHIYKDLMVALRESYKELFAADENELFPMISSQIYPWKYTLHDDSHVGYMNKCFSDLGAAFPELYPFVPLCDLAPIWTYHCNNHPIHPAHKYALGSRFALLCENLYYGRDVKNVQRIVPMLKSCVRHGNKLRLTFDNVGSGIYLKGNKLRGMYIRSKDGAYLPAECEIVGRRAINVFAVGVDEPLHAAYAVSSFEMMTTLMAGEFPVAPFCTEFDKGTTSPVIRMKPWLDMNNDSEFFVERCFSDTVKDAGYKPIYYPSENSFICYDSIYSLSGRSLKIMGEGKRFGTYILSKLGATIDLENYKALKLSVYNAAQMSCKLIIHYKEENNKKITYSVCGVSEGKLNYGWERISYELEGIPNGEIEKAEFVFEQKTPNVPFVHIDCPEIIAKR